jgi:hypothetical protein
MVTIRKCIWTDKCVDVCLPVPSCCRGSVACVSCGCEAGGCDAGCGGSDAGCGGACCQFRVPVPAPPQCCKMGTKKILLRGYCEIQVPRYRCVVTGCGDGCGEGAPADEAAPVAPAPAVQAMFAAPLPPM